MVGKEILEAGNWCMVTVVMYELFLLSIVDLLFTCHLNIVFDSYLVF